MISRSRPATALSLALAVTAATLPVAAQAPLPGVFEEILEVRVVNLEVVVTDRQGIRVHGLRPGDFRLWVDGEETPIDYFTEVRSGEAFRPPGREGPKAVPSVPTGGPVGTSYLVFVDDFFSVANDRDRVLEALQDQVLRLGREDRMAIVAYDGKELQMVSTWSQSPVELQAALRRASERPAWGLQRVAERRQLDLDLTSARRRTLRRTSPLSSFLRRNQLDGDERYYADRLTEQVERSVAAAVATLHSFASPPGRKVLLLLSGGWPFRPAATVVGNQEQLLLEGDLLGGEPLFRPLTDTANLLGYTVYPVDVPGLEAAGGDVESSRPAPALTFSNEQVREIEDHFTLEFVAEETGGEALLNGRRLVALERAAADTRSYYWLGFTPRRKGDDQRHDLRIEVGRPGLQVRFRDDFLDFSRPAEVTMAVESALLFGNAPSSRTIPVEVGEPRRVSRGRIEVPLTVGIPLDAITMVPGRGEWTARLELRVAVRDEEGATAPVPVVPLTLTTGQRPKPGSWEKYDTVLKLRRARHDLVVAVYDPGSGALFSATAEVRP